MLAGRRGPGEGVEYIIDGVEVVLHPTQQETFCWNGWNIGLS
jgi:hypothetical protein